MKNKIITYSFTFFLILFLILNIVFKDKIISLNERRKLTLFPTISISNIISGEFMDKFEEYTLDQFPFRDTFRSIKTYISLYLFNKSDSNNLFVKDEYIYKIDYPLNNKSVDNFITKFNNIKNKYLSNNNVYLSIIPDKNYFLDDRYLKIDYNKLINKTTSSIDAKYIDIFPYYNGTVILGALEIIVRGADMPILKCIKSTKEYLSLNDVKEAFCMTNLSGLSAKLKIPALMIKYGMMPLVVLLIHLARMLHIKLNAD